MNFEEENNYNFKITLLGGQAFNWDLINDSYVGFFTDKVLKIKEGNNGFFWQTYPKSDDFNFMKRYLALEDEYENRIAELNKKDEHIAKAIKNNNGLRVLKQDFEQTLLSYILSSNKSVKGVRRAVRNLTEKYGSTVQVGDEKIKLFPTIEQLSGLTEKDFRELGFGFRAKYFSKAVLRLQDKLIIPSDEITTRELLTGFTGIGDKVADCIMTFSLDFRDLTPLDIWGKRVLTDLYGVDSKLSYSEMRNWYRNYFLSDTSLAGQFLFEYIRSAKIN